MCVYETPTCQRHFRSLFMPRATLGVWAHYVQYPHEQLSKRRDMKPAEVRERVTAAYPRLYLRVAPGIWPSSANHSFVISAKSFL